MSEGRLQDWIRYVQERAENVAGDDSQEDAHDEDTRLPPAKSTTSSTSPRAAEARAAGSEDAHVTATPLDAAGGVAVTASDAIVHRDAASRKTRRSRVKGDGDGQGSVRQRQRLRPETRAQMLERLTNPIISLHEASVLLGVCAATVRRYTASGALPDVRTKGGQRRFRLRDVLALERDRKAGRK